MTYKFLADAVLVFHGLFIAFVALGAALVPWRPWVAWMHLPALAWGAGIMLLGGVCPLTPLENDVRRAAGLEGFEGGFIEHYLMPLIYPHEVTRRFQIGVGVLAIGWNVGLYALAWRQRRARKTDLNRMDA